MTTSEEVAIRTAQEQLRLRGLYSAAVRRGAIWPLGTLCQWAGARSKTVFVVVGARPNDAARQDWVMQLHPIGGSHLRQDVWTGMEYMRREDRVVLEDLVRPGSWRGWCSCGHTTRMQNGQGAERRARALLDAHMSECALHG